MPQSAPIQQNSQSNWISPTYEVIYPDNPGIIAFRTVSYHFVGTAVEGVDFTFAANSDTSSLSGIATVPPSYHIAVNLTHVRPVTIGIEADVTDTYTAQYGGTTYTLHNNPYIVNVVPKNDIVSASITGTTNIVEGDNVSRQASYTIALDHAAKDSITVTYTTSDGSAVAGSRYQAVSGSHTFAPGETSWSFPVNVLSDLVKEPDQNFRVSITSALSISANTNASVDTNSSIVNTTITEGTVDVQAKNSFEQLGDVFEHTNNLIQLIGSLQKGNPIIDQQLGSVDSFLKGTNFVVSTAAPFAQFSADLAQAGKTPDSYLRAQKEYYAYKDLDVAIGNNAVKFLFSTAMSAYVASPLIGGAELYASLFLLDTTIAAGLVISAPAVAAAVAAIVAGAAVNYAYDTYLAPSVKAGFQHNYEQAISQPSDTTGGSDPTSNTDGRVADGYIAGATVFADANNNGRRDGGEVSTTTDATGKFILTGGTGPLIAIGGIDISTGLALTTALKAPAGSTIISPLTTIVAGVDGINASKILMALGLPANIDVTTLDPVAAAQRGDASAYLAAVKVYSAAALIGAVGGGTVADGFAAVEALLISSNRPVNFSDPATITALLASRPGLDVTALTALTLTIAETLAAIDAAVQGKSGDALISAASSVGRVAAGVEAQDLAAAGTDAAKLATVADSYTGQHLADAVSLAATQLPAASPVSLTVVPVNVSAISGQSVTGTAGVTGTGVLAGDSSVNGSVLTVSAVAQGMIGQSVTGAYGYLVLNADGSYAYVADNLLAISKAQATAHVFTSLQLTGDPATDNALIRNAASAVPLHDVFTFTVSDGQGGTATSTLDVAVTVTDVGTPNTDLTLQGPGTATTVVHYNDQGLITLVTQINQDGSVETLGYNVTSQGRLVEFENHQPAPSGGSSGTAPPPLSSAGGTASPAAGTVQTADAITSGSLTVDGPGTLVLTGTSTYTGPTDVKSGTLSVNGSIISPVTVESGGTLGGSGSTGTVTVETGGTLSPGNSPGVLTTLDVTLAAGATLKEELGGTGQGQFDQTKVVGAVSLAGANLTLASYNGFVSAYGDHFTIISNDGTDAVQGRFAGLSEGASLTLGSHSYLISYHGGDGNDVVLRDVTLPDAATLTPFGSVAHDPSGSTGAVYALYEALLGRAPDALGLESFAGSLANAAAPRDVAGAILASPEYAALHAGGLTDVAFVGGLYASLLDRAPDASGQAFFLDELSAGLDRATVAVQFAASPEAQAVLAPAFQIGVFTADPIDSAVARLYAGVLGRAPDAGGLTAFGNQVQQVAAGGGATGGAQALTGVAQTMLSSPEFSATHGNLSDADFVDSLYVGSLGRHAEVSGVAFFADELTHGTSRAVVALQITQSSEAQQHLLDHIQQGWHLA